MKNPRIAVALFLIAAISSCAAAQGSLMNRADALFESGKRVEALPLYEALAKANPKASIYAERLMLCLYAKSDVVKNRAKKKKLLERTQAEAKMAATLGSKLEAVEKVAGFDLSRLEKGPEKGATLGQAIWIEGGKYFARPGDTEAIQWYAAAAELEPNVVQPAEYAGDAAQFMGNFDETVRWYKRAIAIDPNAAEVYLHWGDAYIRLKQDMEGAKSKYIDAAVANPYSGKSWDGLQKWVSHENGFLTPPRVELPKSADSSAQEPSSPWRAYWKFRENYEKRSGQPPTFFSDHPSERTYRHSLAEKAGAIRAALDSSAGQTTADGSLQNLRVINKAGMLDCWILISDADEGIAKDYLAYRKNHWALLHAYIERFMIHAAPSSKVKWSRKSLGL